MRKILMQLLRTYADDILTFAGLAVMVYAAFEWMRIAGLFALGASLMLVGYYLARMPDGR